MIYDVIIVGGGPAGLSAATIVGRCRRRVLLCDAGRPRNAASHAMHCFLSRDGIPPAEFLELGRAQLAPYPNLELIRAVAVTAACDGEHFRVILDDGRTLHARKLLLATGVVDDLPRLEGLAELYGTSIHHCPYCDGWEHRDQAIAVYGKGAKGAGLALMLKQWSSDIVLCTDGPSELERGHLERLAGHGIPVREARIAGLAGRGGKLEAVVFSDGARLARQALFFNTGQHQRSPLLGQLGCDFTPKGGVETGEMEETGVPGLYVAGDATRDVQLAIVAAAEGARAAFAINRELLREDGLLI